MTIIDIIVGNVIAFLLCFGFPTLEFLYRKQKNKNKVIKNYEQKILTDTYSDEDLDQYLKLKGLT